MDVPEEGKEGYVRRMYSWIVDLNNYFTASTV